MTERDPERDETELRALFDRTAEAPDGIQLTKLKARAMDLPGRRKRSAFWLFAPLVAVAAAALGVVVLRGGPAPSSAPSAAVAPPGLSESAARAAPTPAPALASSPAPSAEDSDPELDDPDVGDLYAADDDSSAGDLLGPPDDDASEEELDGWLAATDSFLEDG